MFRCHISTRWIENFPWANSWNMLLISNMWQIPKSRTKKTTTVLHMTKFGCAYFIVLPIVCSVFFCFMLLFHMRWCLSSRKNSNKWITTMKMNLLDIVHVHINFRRLEEQISLSAFYSNYSIWSWTNFDKSLFYHYCRCEQTQFFFLEIHQLEMTVTLLLCH